MAFLDHGRGNLVRQPLVRDQRPAAEIDRQRVFLELPITLLRQHRSGVAHLLKLFHDSRFDGDDFIAIGQRLIQPTADRCSHLRRIPP